ncbi:CHAT domain-containing protein [Coleofasciculus sp. F4-SAH-05]|uniref:CHAT domain-containing protein n=1 Tax=Coleofasciculus sp. F4-SAH-05 TaxID=3069525 RepID=UPI0032F668F8
MKLGEGVFGLRRAFAIAGTKTLIMSLWSVPDRATALLMNRFLSNLRQGIGRRVALKEAQNSVISKTSDRTTTSSFMTYYIAPSFRDKLAVHITKNYLDLEGVRVPLILGIHGRKGEGKSFQCELVFEQMGIGVIHISGGELESPDAGDPARLIRLRYREAAEMIKVQGKMCALMINDLDAGVGRFDRTTQYTVNTQLVSATLMNIADHPTDVQLPGSYDANPLHRVPIIVTGNDFSTLYAPLIREGRMEKYYWEPNREERIGIVGGIFAADGLSRRDLEQLVDQFPNQAIDFFSALRSRIYDQQILHFIHDVGLDKISFRVVRSTEAPPEFEKPNFKLSHLIEFGQVMIGEQKQVEEMGLVREYNKALRESPTLELPPARQIPGHNNTQTLRQGNRLAEEPRTLDLGSANQATTETRVNLKTPQHPTPSLDLDIQQQIRELLAQGYRLSLEYANERRFRTNAWKSDGTFQGNEASDVILTLAERLAEHHNEYVRLIGIDPKAKRRILEKVIQRPS